MILIYLISIFFSGILHLGEIAPSYQLNTEVSESSYVIYKIKNQDATLKKESEHPLSFDSLDQIDNEERKIKKSESSNDFHFKYLRIAINFISNYINRNEHAHTNTLIFILNQAFLI